jgi:hypothetical protein
LRLKKHSGGFDYKAKAAVSFSKNRISGGVIFAPFFGK